MGKPYMLKKCLKNLGQLKITNLHIFFVSFFLAFVPMFAVVTSYFTSSYDIDFSTLLGKIPTDTTIHSQNTLDGQSAQVDFKQGTILKTQTGRPFTGTLHAPKFLDAASVNLTGQETLSVLDIGGNRDGIFLQNQSGAKESSKVKMPAPGAKAGDTVVVNYSQDGNSWKYMITANVFLEQGEPYVEFDTTHFTFFSIGLPVGSFKINDGALFTTGSSVTLNMNVVGATQMRFSNTEAGLTSASWVSYATGYTWTITAVNGIQTVYAEFDGAYGVQTISDLIVYDDTSLSANLLARYNGDINGANIVDTQGTYNLTNVGTVTSVNLSGEQALYFNGTNQYGQIAGAGITAYPFSFSAWINASSIASTDTIISIGASNSATRYWSLQLVNGSPSVVARNTTAFTATYPGVVSVGKRYHVTAVFASATSRKVYLNGQEFAQNTSSVTFSTVQQQLRLGAQAGNTVSNYFHGDIDDARVFNKALSANEIMTMYQSRTVDSDIYLNVGNFSINNGEPTTYTTGVTVTMDVTGATEMRFANTEAGLTSASWVAYTSAYDWILPSGTGNKIVYAEFSGGGKSYIIQDNIFLDSAIGSTLKVLLSSAMSGTTILDSTPNFYHFTGYSSIGTISDDGDLGLSFNGSNKYADRGSIGITAYPFTMSAWIQGGAMVGTDGLVMIGNSAATTTYFGLQLINGTPQIVASNTTAVTAGTTYAIATGAWYHVVGVFSSATSRTLYVNGIQQATSTTSVTFSSTNQQVRLGRFIGATTNYYSGYMDDVRIYSSALTVAQINALYTGRLVPAEKPRARIIYSPSAPTRGSVIATLTGYSEPITILNNGASNIYTFTDNGSFTFQYKDADGNIGSTIAYVNDHIPTDVEPDSFSFDTITGAEFDTYYTTAPFTLTGISAWTSTNLTVDGTAVIIRNGVVVGSSTEAVNGDQIALGMTGLSTEGASITSTLYAGTLSGSFTIISKYLGTDPTPFTFDAITGAELNQVYTSNQITLTGMSAILTTGISLEGSGILYKNGINIGTSGTGGNGDQFYVEITSSSAEKTSLTGTVHIGTVSAPFVVTTKQTIWDSDPDQFIFDSITGAELGIYYTSNLITLAGIEAGTSTYLTISGTAEIIKNGVTIGSSCTGVNGDQIRLGMTGSSMEQTTVWSTLYAGTTSGSFSITTKQVTFDTMPDSFSFTPVIDAELSTYYFSNTITLTGLEIPVDLTLSGAGAIFKNGINIGTGGTGFNGDDILLRIWSSTLFSRSRIGTLQVGSGSADFVVTTMADYIEIPATLDTGDLVTQLIASGFVQGIGGVGPMDPDMLLTNIRIRTFDSSGAILVSMILQSSGLANPIELELSANTYIKTDGGDTYTGIINLPTQGSTSIGMTGVLSVVSFGNTGNTQYIEDDNGDAMSIMIRVPTPGKQDGDLIKVMYRDGSSWIFAKYAIVTLLSGSPYIEFTTSHINDFALIDVDGVFVINAGGSSTPVQQVTLNNAVSGATGMRFSNDGSSWSSWDLYSNTKQWNLLPGSGNKTVYAQFLSGGNLIELQDTITYIPDPNKVFIFYKDLTGGNSSDTIDIGTYSGSYASINANSDTNHRFVVDDRIGNSFTITVQASDMIAGSNIIPADAIGYVGNSWTVSGTSLTSFPTGSLDIGTSPVTFVARNNANGTTYAYQDLKLKIQIPAAQAPGSYQGVLTFTY